MKTNRYVSVYLLNVLLSYAEVNHFDMNTIINLSGIDPAILKSQNEKIEIEKLCSVVSAIVSTTENEISSLHLTEQVKSLYYNNQILMTIMSNCPTLEKSIEKLIQYHDISSNAIQLQLKKENRFSSLVFETNMKVQPQFIIIFSEAVILSCAIMFKDLTMGKLKIANIHFTHSNLNNQIEYQNRLGCPVIFNSYENKIVLSGENLSLPVTLSDPELLVILENYAQKLLSQENSDNLLSEKIVALISDLIILGKDYSIYNVSKKLVMGVRSLQKQLKRENTTYRKLVEQVKKNTAIKCLGNKEIPLSDIAFLLGYSEQSAFNHAFKNWTGSSPREYKLSVL